MKGFFSRSLGGLKGQVWILTGLLLGCALSAKAEVNWRSDLEQAMVEAQDSQRLVMVHFYADWCGPCLRLEKNVYGVKQVGPELEKYFVPVKIDIDKHPQVPKQYGVKSWPTDVLLAPTGKLLAKFECAQTPQLYLMPRVKAAEAYFQQARAADVARRPEAAGPSQPLFASAPVGSRGASGRGVAAVNTAAPAAPADSPAGPESAPEQQAAAPPSPAAPASETANAAPSGRPARPVALRGYDLMELLGPQRAWVAGDPRFGVIHQGRTYLFQSAENQKAFFDQANQLAPVAGGRDPVQAIDFDRLVEGELEFAAIYADRLYLFTSKSSMERFNATPEKYTDQAMRTAWANRMGNLRR